MKTWIRNLKKRFRPLPNPSDGFVTGEKIQLLCDHFIGTEYDFTYNPILKKRKTRWLYLNQLNSSFENKPLVFCYTHLLSEPELLIQKLKWLKNPFNLVFHNSDYDFTESHLQLLEDLPNLVKIFSQNPLVRHKKLTPLPLGLANSMWKHDNVNIMKRIAAQDWKKENLIYFNFKVQTNKDKREECFQKISAKGIEFLPTVNFETYLKKLSTYQYAICPEGFGTDTHRFWECLCLNVIPICKKNPLVEYLAKDFPVILLNNWDDLNVSELESSYDSFQWDYHHKLDMCYYKNLLSF